MWIDVYVIDGQGKQVFRQRVERPTTDAERHALHLNMCKHLSDTPMTPLPMDKVVLKDFPPGAGTYTEGDTRAAR